MARDGTGNANTAAGTQSACEAGGGAGTPAEADKATGADEGRAGTEVVEDDALRTEAVGPGTDDGSRSNSSWKRARSRRRCTVTTQPPGTSRGPDP